MYVAAAVNNNGLFQRTKILWDMRQILCPWLFAAPKNKRSKRLVRNRRLLQWKEFSEQNRIDKFDKCPYCGSWKHPEQMCLFCFQYIRNKVNEAMKFTGLTLGESASSDKNTKAASDADTAKPVKSTTKTQ
jgi:ribosomal protein L32